MLRSGLLCPEEQLIEAPTNPERIVRLEKFLIGRMIQSEPDKLALAVLALIHQSKGNIRIKALVQQLHTSQSLLEKRFPAAVGASPLLDRKSALPCPPSLLQAVVFDAGEHLPLTIYVFSLGNYLFGNENPGSDYDI